MKIHHKVGSIRWWILSLFFPSKYTNTKIDNYQVLVHSIGWCSVSIFKVHKDNNEKLDICDMDIDRSIEELGCAIEENDFKYAAELRDHINMLKRNKELKEQFNL